MKDANFLKAHNARSLWHPMTAPSDSLKNPPAIITGAQGTSSVRWSACVVPMMGMSHCACAQAVA